MRFSPFALLFAVYLFAVPQAYAAGDIDLLTFDGVTHARVADAPPADLAPVPDPIPLEAPAEPEITTPAPVTAIPLDPKPTPPLEVAAPPVVIERPAIRAPEPKKEIPKLVIAKKKTFTPADNVLLTIANEPDISGKYIVLPDGTAIFPLIGAVPVAGKTAAELRQALIAKYQDGYLVDPQITVTAGTGP